MNVVDSSAWLEYFGEAANATYFATPIEHANQLLIPTITLYEVFKRVFQQRGEWAALEAMGLMKTGAICHLNEDIALAAASISLRHKLALADSVIYATALEHKAILWTQDEHFKGLPSVNYKPKPSARRKV